MQAAGLHDCNNRLVRLPPVLDLAAADGFLDLLRNETAQDDPLQLDASGVETLTLPCVQIILAAFKSSGRISIAHPSAEFVAAFDDLGLAWQRAGDQSPGDAGYGPGGRTPVRTRSPREARSNPDAGAG